MKNVLRDTINGILTVAATDLFVFVGYQCWTTVSETTGWASVSLAFAAFGCLAGSLLLVWGIGFAIGKAIATLDKETAIQGDEDEPQAT